LARLAPQSNPGQPRSGGGVFHTLGELVSRFRWVVVALWIAGLVVGYPVYQKLSTVLVSGGYEVPTSDSGRGTRILEDEFGRRTVTTTLVLFTSERVTLDDPTDPSFRDAVTRSA
jgi:uncharacterized membrane protein YdfJ with MMPL/SSD domain